MSREATEKSKYVWNLAGNTMNSLLTVIMLLAVNRIIGEETGGAFSFAYANAQAFQYIAMFEVRPYQVTDVKKRFPFSAYFTLRILTCLVMLVMGGGYILLSDFSTERKLLLAVLCLFKALEAAADIFAGAYQQNERIDLSGKNMTLRCGSSLLVFTLVLAITKDLLPASVAMCLAVIMSMVLFDSRVKKGIAYISCCWNTKEIRGIFLAVFPLAVASVIRAFMVNAPKYVIDYQLDDVAQNQYGILFLPSMVVNLLGLFIFYPRIARMTEDWNEKKYAKLRREIRIVLGILTGATVVCAVVAVYIGIPVLELLYGVSLASERNTMAMIMVFGGMNAIEIFLYHILVSARKQRIPLCTYPVAVILLFVLTPRMIREWNLFGAALSLTISFAAIVLIYGVIVYRMFHKE